MPIFRFCCVILESGPLGDDRQQGRRGAARAVHARLPFTDGLLAGPQLFGQLALGQAQVASQGQDAFPIPFLTLSLPAHIWILHVSV